LHCHGVSATRQERDLSRLRRADLTVDLVSHRLPQHMRYVCLHMLVRWYQRHKRHHGHKLKVITLTRDPVNRYASNLMQHRSVARSQIISWQRARLGRGVKTSIEETQAIHDFVVELASIIVAAHASKGVEACLACEALPAEGGPP